MSPSNGLATPNGTASDNGASIQASNGTAASPSTNGAGEFSDFLPDPDTKTLVAEGDFTTTIEHFQRIGSQHPVVGLVVEGDGQPAAVPVSFWLAHDLAATGARVLVVDLELTQPRIHGVLKTSLGPGVAEVLSGEVTLKHAVRRSTQLGSIEVLTAGEADASTSEALLNSMAEFLTEARRRYHVILLAGGKVHGSSDLRTIARHTDGVLVGTGLEPGVPADAALMEQLDAIPADILAMISIHRSADDTAGREAAGTGA